jgi:hypothetical protein
MYRVKGGGNLPPIVTKVNNILKLQSFLEHNHFGCKPINKV